MPGSYLETQEKSKKETMASIVEYREDESRNGRKEGNQRWKCADMSW
jgi:hypothetical protein